MNSAYRAIYRITKPWYYHYDSVMTRCYGRTQAYFKRGITLHLTANDVKWLWIRDRAALMYQPSLDRIDTQGHYTLANCRFIELVKNKSRQKYQWRKADKNRGVHYDHDRRQWRAHLTKSGRSRFLGRFPTKAKAQAAYNKEARMIYGKEALMSC